jgi:hypothetical protein
MGITTWGNVYGIIESVWNGKVTVELHRKDDNSIIPTRSGNRCWTSSIHELAGLYIPKGGQLDLFDR